jgi:hypothetical protein
MRNTKAGEPKKLEHPLLDTKKSQIETIDVISEEEYQSLEHWEEEYYEKIGALNERAEKPTFSKVNSDELNAVKNEVSRLAHTGQIYLQVAYQKYLSAIGFSVEDAKLLVDNIEGPCNSNIFEKVRHAERALAMETVIFL